MGTTGYAVISDCGIVLSQLKVSEPFALSAASNAIANVLQNLHSPFTLASPRRSPHSKARAAFICFPTCAMRC